MYGASKRLLDLFVGWDVLVVIDDWKGPESGGARSPAFYLGRTFYRSDFARLDDLLDALDEAGAADWHASKGTSLFKSPSFPTVTEALDRVRSELFSFNPTVGEFQAKHLDEEWTRIRNGPVGLAWKTESPYAKALMAYLERLGHHLNRKLPRGLKSRIIMNRVDWRPDTVDEARGLACLGIAEDGRGGVWSIADPKRPQAAAYAPLLGLIDSEAWAWGRLQTRVLPSSGRTIREAMLSWVDNGRSEDEIVVSDADMRAIVDGVDAPLADYWKLWIKWRSEGKTFELPRQLSPTVPPTVPEHVQ